MKKSLLALAVLGAFAGAASAQSSVTIYGVVDASVASVDTGPDRTTMLNGGDNGASRIGFKGVEDLGNGLKAEFLLENGFDTDTGASGDDDTAFSRLAYVGLHGGFGTVRLGRQNTQLKNMLGQIDPFGASGAVNAVDFFNGGGLDQRLSNQITWTSNNYGGFSGELGYVFGETAGSTGDNSGYGARLGYKNGPLNVELGYQNANLTDGTVPVDADQENIALGATYDFGGFKLHGMYGEKKTDAGFAGAGTGDEKVKSGLIGVTVPFGASKIRAEYVRNDSDAADADSNLWAVSYTYAMSKRTTLYATYLRTSNDDASSLGYGGPGGVSVAGENGSAAIVGIAHTF